MTIEHIAITTADIDRLRRFYSTYFGMEAEAEITGSSGDISKATYFIPMFDGGFTGYYKILGLTFGKRQQDVTDKDGMTIRIDMPCLNIHLGEFTPLGSHTAVLGDVRKWNGQIHTFAEVTQLYTSQNNETL